MIHTFDTEVAMEVGVNAAIIFQNINYWIEKNKANERHFHDGNYWTYNSVKAFETLFPYLTSKQIRSALNSLCEDGYLISANYNASGYDRTRWYAITQKGHTLLQKGKCIFPTGQMEVPKRANGFAPEGEPIPNINTDIKPESKQYSCASELHDADIENFFESIWQLYPIKKGKGSVSKTQQKKLYNIGYEQLERCVDRYLSEVKDKDRQFWKNGSTFFNSGYVDYLDKNWQQEEKRKPKKQKPTPEEIARKQAEEKEAAERWWNSLGGEIVT